MISYCLQERRCIYCIWAQVWCDQEANRNWSWYWWSRENAPQDSGVRLDTDIPHLDTKEEYSGPRYNWRIFWTQIQLKDILDPDTTEGNSEPRYNWRIFWTQIQLKDILNPDTTKEYSGPRYNWRLKTRYTDVLDPNSMEAVIPNLNPADNRVLIWNPVVRLYKTEGGVQKLDSAENGV